MEQLSFPTAKQPGRQCSWEKQNDKRLKKLDDPYFCNFMAEDGSRFCQKHTIIAKTFGVYPDGRDTHENHTNVRNF